VIDARLHAEGIRNEQAFMMEHRAAALETEMCFLKPSFTTSDAILREWKLRQIESHI